MNRKLTFVLLTAGLLLSFSACTHMVRSPQAPVETTQAILTNSQALNAITNYLVKEYGQDKPAGDAPSYWVIDETQTDDKTVVVNWRSYTAAHVYFYIDRASGETYVMESEPGSEKKVKTDKKFNAKDYLDK